MRGDEWDAWRTWAVNGYADDMMRNEELHRERALAQAAEETDTLLTNGLGTPGHHLFVAEEVDTGKYVGAPRVTTARTSTSSLRCTTWREAPARVAPTRWRRRVPPRPSWHLSW